jgi:hypothetical protein
MSFVEYSNVIRDFIIDFTALYFFAYVILYRKYRNKELFVTCSLFNVFMLIVIMSIVRTNFNIAIGFGLFALLSMVQLRSEAFTKAEMAYLFGGVSLAVINGAGIADLTFVITSNFVIIIGAWVISTWSIDHSANIIDVDNIRKMIVTLDHIDEVGIKNHLIMKEKLIKLFNLNVISFEIRKIDYVKDLMELVLVYQLTDEGALQFVEHEDDEPTLGEIPEAQVEAAGR